MATDLYNDEANKARIIRWGKAFYNESLEEEAEEVTEAPISGYLSHTSSTSNSRKKFIFDQKAT
jgi:hypothetical protein